jgi:hypothetical protein
MGIGGVGLGGGSGSARGMSTGGTGGAMLTTAGGLTGFGSIGRAWPVKTERMTRRSKPVNLWPRSFTWASNSVWRDFICSNSAWSWAFIVLTELSSFFDADDPEEIVKSFHFHAPRLRQTPPGALIDNNNIPH